VSFLCDVRAMDSKLLLIGLLKRLAIGSLTMFFQVSFMQISLMSGAKVHVDV
jgi:hypothetical protein